MFDGPEAQRGGNGPLPLGGRRLARPPTPEGGGPSWLMSAGEIRLARPSCKGSRLARPPRGSSASADPREGAHMTHGRGSSGNREYPRSEAGRPTRLQEVRDVAALYSCTEQRGRQASPRRPDGGGPRPLHMTTSLVTS